MSRFSGPLIFILPPLFYTKMLKLQAKFEQHQRDIKKYEFSEDNDEQLLLKSSTEYGTLDSTKTKPKKCIIKRAFQSDCLLSGAVIVFGLLATFSSTFYNILDIKNFNQFWSPCIQNISLSYKFLDF